MLARPVAVLFGSLGFAPGQLSLQSLTLSILGVLRMADGRVGHIWQGAAIIYVGLLLDRADDLIAARRGRIGTWPIFLDVMANRIVEALLIVTLGVLAVRAESAVPSWEPMSNPWFLVVLGATLAAMLLWHLAMTYGDLLALRTHLLVARRIPGPSNLAVDPPVLAYVTLVFDRDLFVLLWAAGAVLEQYQLTAVLLCAFYTAALVEAIVVVWRRRLEPETHAGRILATDYF